LFFRFGSLFFYGFAEKPFGNFGIWDACARTQVEILLQVQSTESKQKQERLKPQAARAPKQSID
jgi:hypothetical protein